MTDFIRELFESEISESYKPYTLPEKCRRKSKIGTIFPKSLKNVSEMKTPSCLRIMSIYAVTYREKMNITPFPAG